MADNPLGPRVQSPSKITMKSGTIVRVADFVFMAAAEELAQIADRNKLKDASKIQISDSPRGR